jgi:hypothetical protein
MFWIIIFILVLYLLFNNKEKFTNQESVCSHKSCSDMIVDLAPTNGYEPETDLNKWNDDKNIKHSHNCYSYFLNDINKELEDLCQDGECKYINPQPGHCKEDIKVNFENTICEIFHNRILSDNPSIYVEEFGNKCKDGFYKGALTIDPKHQYHFYRQDKDGLWSHKDGGKAATNRDANGCLIYDPKISNKCYTSKDKDGKIKKTHYSDFCNYYCIPNNDHSDTVMSRRKLNGGLKYQPGQNINKKECIQK